MGVNLFGRKLKTDPKARVFISYSRKDMILADRLEAALMARGFEPLIDRSEIYALEEWWKRIEALIVLADTAVFVLSPDAVVSNAALREVSFAASLNKRFAPVVWRRVDDKALPEALAKLNFIFFDDDTQFEMAADRLAEALKTDIAWIRQHTEFGEQARRWILAKRPIGLLLRSPALEQAEAWIAARPREAPGPTEETQAFIRRSRQATTRRRDVLTGTLTAGLVLAFGLAGIAYWQRDVAVQQRKQALISESMTRSEQASRALAAGDAATAILLALEGLPDAASADNLRATRPSVPQTEEILKKAVQRLREVSILDGHADMVFSAVFSPDGGRILTASADKTAQLWTPNGRHLVTLSGHTARVHSAVFSADGLRILTASDDGTARLWTTDGKWDAKRHLPSSTFGSLLVL
jgi:hypothetical protein